MTTDTSTEAVERPQWRQYDGMPWYRKSDYDALAAERDALQDRLSIYEGSTGPVSVSGIVQDMEGTIAALRADALDWRGQVGEMSDQVKALRAELVDANHTIVAYVAINAVEHAEGLGLPKGHLAPHHYDILQKAGARMDSFTRAALDAKP